MALGRPLQFDPEDALERAMQCFWRHGYAGASLATLLAATGLSRSSLYHAFGGKQTLFRRCIERYAARMAARFAERLAAASDGRRFIADFLYGVAAEAGHAEQRGCLLMNSAVEFGQGDRRVAAWIQDGLHGVLDVFVAAVERGQREGGITAPHDARRLAAYLMSCVAGLRTMVKAGTDQATLHAAAGLMLGALDRTDSRARSDHSTQREEHAP